MRLLILLALYCSPVGAVTYEEVQPILVKRCAACHQHMADKDWSHKENADAAKVKIRLRVENGTMPPPPMPITEEEKRIIIDWTKSTNQWTR